MIWACYRSGWRALTPFARRAALATLALAILGSYGVALLRSGGGPATGEAKYSAMATRAVVRGGR